MMLEVKDLRVHYGKGEALKGISITVDEGTIVTLIGANGAGKTTALRTISGFQRPTSGEIWFMGNRIDRMLPHSIVKLGISHVLEGGQVLDTMTVKDNLMLGAYLRKDKHEITADLERIYEKFPILKERGKKMASSLSGGMRQMLVTARALMANPKLLLMDEPSLGLAPLLVVQVGEMITGINQRGVSIILVEQNARMALRLAKTAYVLETGRMALKGQAKDLVHDKYVRQCYLGVS